MARNCLLLVTVLAVFVPPVVGAETVSDSEAVVKAALLYKLTQFVTWPKAENGDDELAANDVFVFCAVTGDVSVDALATLEGRLIGEQKIVLRRLLRNEHTVPSPDDCNALYFPSSAPSQNVASILREINGQRILTIGDVGDFATKGGMIEITKNRQRLGFRINASATERAGLRIAAPLLQMSKVVEE